MNTYEKECVEIIFGLVRKYEKDYEFDEYEALDVWGELEMDLITNEEKKDTLVA